jgi:hypothetical protein
VIYKKFQGFKKLEQARVFDDKAKTLKALVKEA